MSMEENCTADVQLPEDIPNIGVTMYVEMDIGIIALIAMVGSINGYISWNSQVVNSSYL